MEYYYIYVIVTFCMTENEPNKSTKNVLFFAKMLS